MAPRAANPALSTVATILIFYRNAFGPGKDSPLVNAGDPADGAGCFIGAVGSGSDVPGESASSDPRESHFRQAAAVPRP